MRYYLYYLCSVTCALIVVIVSMAIVSDDPLPLSQVDGNNTFAFDLYGQLKGQKGNVFFSPYSVSSALAMTASGAAGTTKEEMDKVLHLSGEPEPLVTTSESSDALPQLRVANSIWIQTNFAVLPGFVDHLINRFSSTVQKADFAKDSKGARDTINGWVEQKTQGKIRDLFPPNAIDASTRLVLVSAIYMMARWSLMFDPKATVQKPFHETSDHKTTVDMMSHKGFYRVLFQDQIGMIELSYAVSNENDPELAMMIILPNDFDGLAQLEDQLDLDQVKSWMNKMKSRHVQLSLPKFKIEDDLALNDTLEAMGMRQAFSSEADFSGMTSEKNLAINKVVHKSFIDVDEKGTEAAAATGVSMNLLSVRETTPPYQFVVDHPFFFFIIDKRTDTILFMGRLAAFH